MYKMYELLYLTFLNFYTLCMYKLNYVYDYQSGLFSKVNNIFQM